VFHRLEERVKAHVLICMPACYLTWHLRQAWAPLTFTDESPAAPENPSLPPGAPPAPNHPANPAKYQVRPGITGRTGRNVGLVHYAERTMVLMRIKLFHATRRRVRRAAGPDQRAREQ
jgi:hypothetical protein